MHGSGALPVRRAGEMCIADGVSPRARQSQHRRAHGIGQAGPPERAQRDHHSTEQIVAGRGQAWSKTDEALHRSRRRGQIASGWHHRFQPGAEVSDGRRCDLAQPPGQPVPIGGKKSTEQKARNEWGETVLRGQAPHLRCKRLDIGGEGGPIPRPEGHGRLPQTRRSTREYKSWWQPNSGAIPVGWHPRANAAISPVQVRREIREDV